MSDYESWLVKREEKAEQKNAVYHNHWYCNVVLC